MQWKQPRCVSIDKWMDKLWLIQTMKCYLALKINQPSNQEKMWRKLTCIFLSERSQSEKTVYYTQHHHRTLWNRQNWCRSAIKLVVASGSEGREGACLGLRMCPPMQEVWVQFLVQEDPTCLMRVSPCVTTTEPKLWSLGSTPGNATTKKKLSTATRVLTAARERPHKATQAWHSPE